jgi:hypothetical protein
MVCGHLRGSKAAAVAVLFVLTLLEIVDIDE